MKDHPKPLFKVAGQTVLDFIVEKVNFIDEVIVITNEKFTPNFEEWADNAAYSKQLIVINDGTTTNENRLGAIGDIQYVIKKKNIQDDVLILAGDNLFDFELTDFVDYFKEVGTDCITAYEENNREDLRRAGIVVLDENCLVQSFEEKPEEPKTNYAVLPFYIYHKETLQYFKEYLAEGNDPDAPGHFIPYLLSKKDIHAYTFKGNRYDIGTLESYRRVREMFENRS